jgi:hypothetical protein
LLHYEKLFLIIFLFFSGCTPLHFAAINGAFEVCRLLIQCNANVEAKDYTVNGKNG